jgi:NADH-quinone oxidoreductase subunit C
MEEKDLEKEMPSLQYSLLVKKIRDKFGESIRETAVFRGEVTHVVEKDILIDVCRFLKDESGLQFDFLSDVLGVDCRKLISCFEVVYHLYSIPNKFRIRLKVRIKENEAVPSVTPLWRSADFAERETFDMFGIVFEGHPNLKRIYMPSEWEGYPLRKDYPLVGYKDEYNPFGVEKK